MRTLILTIFLLTLVSCNGGSNGAAPSIDIEDTNKEVSSIIYNSLGAYSTYNYYGTILERSLGAPISKNEITIPETLTVLQDENNSLRNGDTAYLMMNNYFENRCEYIYDGDVFNFNECKDDVAGFLAEDTIVLNNYIHPSTGVDNEVVLMLFGRTQNDLHTGTIKIEGQL